VAGERLAELYQNAGEAGVAQEFGDAIGDVPLRYAVQGDG
jgi:hypothetical protein